MLGWEFPPAITGGLGVHCFELVSSLGELGIKIDLYLPLQKSAPVSPHPNVKIIQVGGGVNVGAYGHASGGFASDNYSRDLIGAIEDFARLSLSALKASGTRYDLVHCHDWLTISAGIMAQRALGIPLVLTMHSTEYDRNPVPWSWISGIESLGVKTADRTIAVSGKMKGMLVEKFHADDGRIRVVYNGIDIAKYRRKDSGIRKEKLVLFLGRLTHQKGPEQFLRAAEKVHQYDRNARFLVVGEGGLLPRLISLSIELGIADRVSFWGFVPENEKRSIYSMCDVYVMPSVSEPFGISALEAMASGTPCIISKNSGVSEIARNCLLVDFWDIDEMASQILALLRYPAMSRVMSAHEMKDAARLGWQETARKTIGVYNEVLGK
ncbi:MAG: glycosyltransferase family 4 protein [Candidatus Micrarchaeota archaeon]|nr:glycosyltransferase family 4 protein [Candidatus Micrarchaeota archaeon]